jgi:uncharacterized membrane protein HdeD (DUF308 family)
MTDRYSGPLAAGIHEVLDSWGWFLALGILLILFGLACIARDVTATFATVFFFGWFFLISGVIVLIQAFRVHRWSGFFLYLFNALLRGFTGYVLIRYPLAGAIGLTLMLSVFFIVSGIFRAVAAGNLRFPQWGWAVFSGLISLLLGILLLAQIPLSSVWFIGFAIGIDLVLEGVSLIGLAAGMRRLHHDAHTAHPAPA